LDGKNCKAAEAIGLTNYAAEALSIAGMAFI